MPLLQSETSGRLQQEDLQISGALTAQHCLKAIHTDCSSRRTNTRHQFS